MKQNKTFKIIGSLMILITILSVVNASTFSNSISTFTGNIDMGLKELYNLTNVNTTNLYASVVNTTNLWIGATKVNASNLLPLTCANNTVGKYDTATGIWLCQSETDPIFLSDNSSIWTAINNRALLTQLNTMNTSQFVDNTTIKDSYIKTLDTNDNVTTIQVTGTGTKTLTLEQTGGNVNKTASWIDIDTTYTNTTGLTLAGTVFGLDTVYAVGQYMTRSNWTSIDNYPSACSGQFVTGIGDTLTCATPSDVKNVTSIQATGTTTKTLNLEQGGITNRTATWADLTNSSADMVNAINNTAGLYTLQGLNISTSRVNMNAQNLTFSLGEGLVLNQSQSYKNIYANASGCPVIQGPSGGSVSIC